MRIHSSLACTTLFPFPFSTNSSRGICFSPCLPQSCRWNVTQAPKLLNVALLTANYIRDTACGSGVAVSSVRRSALEGDDPDIWSNWTLAFRVTKHPNCPAPTMLELLLASMSSFRMESCCTVSQQLFPRVQYFLLIPFFASTLSNYYPFSIHHNGRHNSFPPERA